MTFNPANFTACTTHAQVNSTLAAALDAQKAAALKVAELEQAAARFAIRRDSFAVGKQHTCLDMAARLQKFGAFASEKQAEFADKLIAWSKPREQAAPAATPVQAMVNLPKLFALMGRLAKLEIGKIAINRENGGSRCWIRYDLHSGVIGKIEDGVLYLFQHRIPAGTNGANVRAELEQIEADPEAAAVLHGKVSGRCALCGADLTNPESIERGVGPICAGKF